MNFKKGDKFYCIYYIRDLNSLCEDTVKKVSGELIETESYSVGSCYCFKDKKEAAKAVISKLENELENRKRELQRIIKDIDLLKKNISNCNRQFKKVFSND